MNKIIARLRGKLTHGSFGRNVLIMFTGTVLGQLTSVLLSPVLTRIYSPELFGLLGFFTAVIGILSVISALRYEMALPLTGSKEEAANLLAVCCVVLVSITVIFYGLLFFIPPNLISYLFGSLFPYRFLLPVGLFFIGAYQIMISYATREGEFSIISKTKIYQGVIGPVSQIAMGLMGTGAWGLIIGFILGQSAGAFNMFVRLVLKSRQIIQFTTYKGMVEMARRFSRFPLVSTWSALISVFGSNSLLLIIIPTLYSSSIAGFVFLTDRIIGRPLLLISTSILQVYIGEAAKTQTSDPKAMRRRFLQITRIQSIIVSAWLILINATAFYFVPIIFGKEWAGATIYINILSICYLPQMVMTSVTHTLQIMEKQGLMAIWEFSRFLLIASGFVASYLFGLSAVQMILIYSISQAIMQVTLFFLMYISIQRLLAAQKT